MRKIKRIRKRIYASLVTLGISATMGLAVVGGVNGFSNHSTSTNNATKASSSLQKDSSNASSYLLPWNISSTNDANLSSPKQNIAYDASYSSFVMLTSTTSTYKSSSSISTTTNDKYEVLTCYNITAESTSNKAWTYTASSLTNLPQNSNNSQKNTGASFVAVAYIPAFANSEAVYLTVVKSNNNNNNYYLVSIGTDGTLKGSCQLDNTAPTDAQYYIVSNSSSTFNASVFEISKSSSSGNTFNVSVYNTTSVTLSTSIASKTTTISNDLINSYFSTTTTTTTGTDGNSTTTLNSKLATIYTDQNFIYFVFQKDKVDKLEPVTNYATILRLATNTTDPVVDTDSLFSVSLDTNEVNELMGNTDSTSTTTETQTTTPVASTATSVNNFIVSIADDDTNANLLISSTNSTTVLSTPIDPSVFNGGSSDVNFTTLTNVSKSFIVSISPLYADDGSNSGYVALLSDNKAVQISADFTSISLLYDFSNLTTNNNDSKLIFNVFTLKNDANWYAQMTDGSIIQFSGTNLVGQMGSNNINNRTEFVASIALVPQSEIQTAILYQKVTEGANTTSGQASATFSTYIQNNASEFINVESFDSVFGEPEFTAKVNSVTQIANSNGNYSVSISFIQKLRSIQNGSITTTSPTEVTLATQVYTFTNADVSVTQKDRSSVPASITSLIPSKVTESDLDKILNIQNAGNYTMTLTPDDTKGTLAVTIKSDVAWVGGKLQNDYSQTITLGDDSNPYFAIDYFNGLDTSVTFITDDYLNANPNLKTTLTNQFSTTLPSNVTSQDIIDNFIIFGNAFSSTQLINNNIISSPDDTEVQLYPLDSTGKLFVNITIPKIGSKTNVNYSFTTATVFQADPLVNQNVYFNFVNNQTVLNTSYTAGTGQAQTQVQLNTQTPSSLVNLINTDKTFLFNFIDMSNYVYNLIAGLDNNNKNAVTLSLNPDDSLGTLTIAITFNQQINGLNPTYSYKFTGFTTTNTNFSGAPTNMPGFSWGTLTATAFADMTPSQVTPEYLQTNYPGLFVYTNSADQLSHTITTTPMNASGEVLVTITFTDWWQKSGETNNQTTQKLPEKSFTTVLKNGLKQVQDSVDSIVWKSFAELGNSNAAITASSPSNALTLIQSSGSDFLTQLGVVANVSNSLKSQLQTAIAENPDALSLSFNADDAKGTLSMYVKITLDGKVYSFSNVLSGFDLVGANYSVSLANETSDAINKLKGSIPSDLSYEQIASLVTVNLGNGLTKDIKSTYDDVNGTLTITVTLNNDNETVATTTKTYTGFAKANLNYQGTNILIVSLAVIIPIILLLTPILYIKLFKNRLETKKLAKVLDKRLTQEQHKKRNVEVSSIEDLLKIDADWK